MAGFEVTTEENVGAQRPVGVQSTTFFELLFKWIKQHLRIKAFYGTSENAVKSQIWIAISVYVLVAIAKKKLQLEQSLYTILQVLSLTCFEKAPLYQVLTEPVCEVIQVDSRNQLNLFNV